MYSPKPANQALQSKFPAYAAGEAAKYNPRQEYVPSVRSQLLNEIGHLKNVVKAKRALEDWNSRPRITTIDLKGQAALAASCEKHQAAQVKADLKKAMNSRASIERQIAAIKLSLRD